MLNPISPWCRRLPGLLSALLLGAAAIAPINAQETAQRLPQVQLSAGMHLIQAEVAAAPNERAAGLMFRTEMAANAGMLFAFEQPSKQCFWMKNTDLPLSAAFVLDNGEITNIEDMKPQTTESHCSTKPVRFVLEMNQGWFAKKGLKAGSKLGGKVFAGGQ